MTTVNQCPLGVPGALYDKPREVPAPAARLMAELLPLVVAKKLLDADSFRHGDLLRHLHKLDLPPHVSEALKLLGLDVPEGPVTLASLAGTLSRRVTELSSAYLAARTGLNLAGGFFVVHTSYVKAEVKFWPAVDDAELSLPDLVIRGWPRRLKADGTFGSETTAILGDWLRPSDSTWIIPAEACPTKKDKVALYRAAVNLAAQVKESKRGLE